MTHRRPITFLATAALIPLTALAIAACGGGGAATASPPPKKTNAPAATTTTIRVAKTGLGSILVNSAGRTLYLFKADAGTTSACTGACAAAWPPLLATGNPAGASGVTAAKLGTTTRPDGGRQVTYNGHPLYLFIMDQRPGDVKGQGVVAFGAAWFAVSPAGNQITRQPAVQHAPAAPAAPQPAPQPAPKPAPKPAPPPAAKPAPKPAPPPAAKPTPPASNGIPQNNGGDGDADNNGGPSDGDGNL